MDKKHRTMNYFGYTSQTSSFACLVVAVVTLLLLVACVSQQSVNLKPGEEVVLSQISFKHDGDQVQTDLFADYRVQPGDVLDVLFQIRTWIKKDRFEVAVDHTITVKFVNSPELNETQRVRPDGNISLPYIGQYYVIDKNVSEVEAELKELYKEELRDPNLYVVIPEFREAIKELKKDLHTAPRGLSRLVKVRPDGKVTFPMVGEMKVANRTISEINLQLNTQYEEILPGLNVDLFLEKHSGSMIYVLGEVNKPGAYPIFKPINLMQALTLAGSYRPSAQLDNTVVVRRYSDKMVATRVELGKTLGFGPNKSAFYLHPDDIVYIPKTRLTRAAEVAQNIASVLFFKGWGLNFSWELHDVTGSSNRSNTSTSTFE